MHAFSIAVVLPVFLSFSHRSRGGLKEAPPPFFSAVNLNELTSSPLFSAPPPCMPTRPAPPAETKSSELEARSSDIDPSTDSPLEYYPLQRGTVGERFPTNDPLKKSILEPRPENRTEYLHGLLQAIARSRERVEIVAASREEGGGGNRQRGRGRGRRSLPMAVSCVANSGAERTMQLSLSLSPRPSVSTKLP